MVVWGKRKGARRVAGGWSCGRSEEGDGVWGVRVEEISRYPVRLK